MSRKVCLVNNTMHYGWTDKNRNKKKKKMKNKNKLRKKKKLKKKKEKETEKEKEGKKEKEEVGIAQNRIFNPRGFLAEDYQSSRHG